MRKVYKIGKIYVIAKNAAEALKIKQANGLRGVLVEVELTIKKGA